MDFFTLTEPQFSLLTEPQFFALLENFGPTTKDFFSAVFASVRDNPTLAAFAGTNGPFWELAPERTAFPFMVINQVARRPLLQGFASASAGGTYVQPIQLQFNVYGTPLETVAGYVDTLCNALDFIDLSDTCRRVRRLEAPRFILDPIAGDGKRIYHGIVSYLFNHQRATGS